jgi:uncharacterized OB-fold protein
VTTRPVTTRPMTTRPVAEPTALGQAYQQALVDGRLIFQRCSVCRNAWLPPRDECPRCLADQWAWEEASGRATLVSWVTYHTAYHPFFADKLPYLVAVIELEEGPRLISNLVGTDEVARAWTRPSRPSSTTRPNSPWCFSDPGSPVPVPGSRRPRGGTRFGPIAPGAVVLVGALCRWAGRDRRQERPPPSKARTPAGDGARPWRHRPAGRGRGAALGY